MDDVQQLVEKLFPKMELDNEEGEKDDFNRPAVTWYDEDEEKIGTYADAADYVLVAKKNTNMGDLIEDNDLDGKVKTGYNAGEEVACGTVVELWVDKKAVETKVEYNYVLVTVEAVEEVDKDDELYEDYGVTVIYDLANNDLTDDVTFVDTLSESKDDYKAIGTFEEDDVLAAVLNEGGEIIEVAKADSFNGKVGAKGTNYVKVDGTKYAALTAVVNAINFDDTFTFYQDPNGVVLGQDDYEEADDALDYVYVLSAQGDYDEEDLLTEEAAVAKIKVMFADGDKKVVNYALTKATKDINNTDIEKNDYYFTFLGTKTKFVAANFENAIPSGWYAYTENDDGALTLKSADKADVSDTFASVTAVKDNPTLRTGLRATSTTKLVVLDEDGLFKTYTGYKNFPKADAADEIENMSALVVFGTSESFAKTVYVYAGNAVEAEEEIDVAMFVSTGDQTDDGFETTFVVEGEKQVYVLESKLSATAGQLFELTVEDDGVTAEATPLTWTGAGKDFTIGMVEAVDEGYIALDNGEFELADDCAVYSVAKDGKSASDGTLAKEQYVAVFADDDGAYAIFIYKTARYNILFGD